MTTINTVHCWHINVSTGDAAIHLLVEESGIAAKVLKAVLIDGGESRLENIKDTIEKIERTYAFADGGTALKFDSVIITHWDSDHYAGVLDLILDDFQLQTGTDAGFQKLLRDSKGGYLSIAGKNKTAKVAQYGPFDVVQSALPPPDPSAFKSRYFKYRSDTLGSPASIRAAGLAQIPNANDALTTLFVPYRCSPSATGARIGPQGPKEYAGTEQVVRAKPKATDPRNIETVLESNPDGVYVPDGANTVSLVGAISYKIGAGVKLWCRARVNKAGTPTSTVKSNPYCYKMMRFNWICNLVDTGYLGAEVFGGNLCVDPAASRNIDQAQLKNPALLIGWGSPQVGWNLLKADGPRMFIVAGSQDIIGNTPLYPQPANTTMALKVKSSDMRTRPKLAFGHNVKVVNTSKGELGRGMKFVPPFIDSHPKNSTSICCVIISRVNDDPQTTAPESSFQILHFLGGDALWDVEGGLASWLQNGKANWPTTSVAMKLSHHGAKESTEVSLFSLLSPELVVASVSSKGEHHHPHAETLAFVDAGIAAMRSVDMNRQKVKANNKAPFQYTDRYPPLLCTNYPGWFVSDSSSSYSLDTFMSDISEDQQFQVDLAALYSLSGMESENILVAFQKAYATTAPSGDKTAMRDREKAMASLLQKRWDFLSLQRQADNGTEPIMAWVLILGSQEDPLKPRHRAFLRDGKKLEQFPAPNLIICNSTTIIPSPPATVDPTLIGLSAATAASSLATGGKKRRKINSRRLATWTRFEIEPEDIEAGDAKLKTKQALIISKKLSKLDTKVVEMVSPNLNLASTLGSKANLRILSKASMVGPSVGEVDSSHFYIFGSTYSITSPNDAQSYAEVAAAPNYSLNDFLNILPEGYLVMDKALNAVGSTLLGDSPLMQAVAGNGLGASEWMLKGSILNGVAKVTEISTSLVSGTYTFEFTTDKTYATMVAGNNPGGFSKDVFYPDYNMLVMGLSSQTPAGTLALGDILKLFGPHWLQVAGDVATELDLPGFNHFLQFTIDTSISSPTRNGLFFAAETHYPMWYRFRFKVTDSNFNSSFTKCLPFLGNIVIGDAYLTCTKSAKSERLNELWKSSISASVLIEAKISFNALVVAITLDFKPDRTELALTFVNPASIGDVIAWLGTSLGIGDPSSLLPGSNNIFVRQITVSLGAIGTNDAFSVGNSAVAQIGSSGGFNIGGAVIMLTLEVDCFNSAFFVQVSWPNLRVNAYLWNEIPDEAQVNMVPWIEPYTIIAPTIPFKPMTLRSFLPDDMQTLDIPSAVDFVISEAEFTAWTVDGTTDLGLLFKATLTMNDQAASGGLPWLEFDSLDMTASRITTDGVSSYDINIGAVMYLIPRGFDPSIADHYAAMVEVGIDISDGLWTISAGAQTLNFAAMYSLFDADASDHVMDIMEHFSIPHIDFTFVYDAAGKTFTLDLNGALQIYTLELDMDYSYNSASKEWYLQAQLGIVAEGANITIVDIISSFNTDAASVLDEVPFIRDVAIPAVNSDAVDFDSAPIQFYMKHAADAVIMWFQIEIDTDIGAFTFLFVQYKPVPTTVPPPAVRPSPKRIIRVRLDSLPRLGLSNIPIVGSIDQPLDSISYLYIQDADGATKNSGPTGFLRAEIDAINGILPAKNQIRFRDTKSNLPGNQPLPGSGAQVAPEYVLLAGHHFIVITDGSVIIDHVFGASQQSTPTKNSNTQPGLPTDTKLPATDGDSGATMGATKKSFPGIPITISSVGVQVKDSHLYILIDAKILLGPIELDLEGFGIGIPLKLKNGDNLSFNRLNELSFDDFDIKLAGVGVYFSAPPVLIAGFFEHEDTPLYESYRGGLAVSILPYTLLAVGAYQHTKQPIDFKSVFVFARLDGPLFTLEFAEISGVEAGFGYNYDLTIPTAANVQNFPLVHGPDSTNNPMDLLSKDGPSSFMQWTKAKEDSLWFAVGLKVDAFQVLTVDAAAIVSFSSDGVKIAIVAIASASMPPSAGKSKPPEAFLYVELGIVASIDITGGSLMVSAQLTPNSYILAPDCHLTGGFALCYWFGSNANAGDWVFTVGGYHPAFNPPLYYPVVPRVGISWNLSDVLTVQGESYFAICPKAAMGGGRLLATFSAGPIYASFEAWASFLINFKPFFFIADIGVNVTVGFELDLWLIHINIHAELGASLHLQGPPFGGVAHVDFYIVGFDVYFGDEPGTPGPLPWDGTGGFLSLVRQPGPGTLNQPVALVVIAIEKGATDQQSAGSTDKPPETTRVTGQKWFVRAGSLQFRIESKFPIGTLNYGDGVRQMDTNTNKGLGSPPIYGRQMQLMSPFASTLTVSIIEPPSVPGSAPMTVATDTSNPWRVEPVIRSLPKALWAQYNENEDPLKVGNSIDTLLNSSKASDSTIDHTCGYTFKAPLPKLPDWSFPEFNAADAMQEGVFQDGITDKPPRQNPILGSPSDIDERPVLKSTPAAQSTDLAAPKKPNAGVNGDDPGPSYDDIESTWMGVDENVTQAVTAAWTAILGWDADASQLSGKTPNALLKGFETYYLAAPCLTA